MLGPIFEEIDDIFRPSLMPRYNFTVTCIGFLRSCMVVAQNFHFVPRDRDHIIPVLDPQVMAIMGGVAGCVI